MGSPRDGNNVPTLRAALNTDGKTVINVLANPTSHALFASNGSSGTNHGTTNAQRDLDHHPILLGVSYVDGKTPVEIYADSNGNLLTTTGV
jgi:hypothetical protein